MNCEMILPPGTTPSDITSWGLANLGIEKEPIHAQGWVDIENLPPEEWYDSYVLEEDLDTDIEEEGEDEEDIDLAEEDEDDEDQYTAMAREASAENRARKARIEALRQHPMVVRFGFAPASLLRFGPEVLGVILASCQAAVELAEMVGKTEVAKVLEWTKALPKVLGDFGADLLFRSASALQARVAEIKATPKAKGGIPTRTGIMPRIAPPARPAPPRPAPAPLAGKLAGTDELGRVQTSQGLAYRCVCGCRALVLEEVAKVPPFRVMVEEQGSVVKPADLWRHSFAPACLGRLTGYSLVETRKQMEEQAKARSLQRRGAVLDLQRRIKDGMKRAKSLNSPGATELLSKAQDTESEVRANDMVEQAERMLDACKPLPPRAPKPACFGSSGKGASPEQRAKKAKKAAEDAAIRDRMKGGGGKK